MEALCRSALRSHDGGFAVGNPRPEQTSKKVRPANQDEPETRISGPRRMCRSLLTLKPCSGPSSPPSPHLYSSTPRGRRMNQLIFCRPAELYAAETRLSRGRMIMYAAIVSLAGKSIPLKRTMIGHLTPSVILAWHHRSHVQLTFWPAVRVKWMVLALPMVIAWSTSRSFCSS